MAVIFKQAEQAKRSSRRFGRFLGDRRGASMVEFAIVAVPVFLLLFGIIEIGLIFWGGYELDSATRDAGRLIRTGQAQTGGMDANAIKSQICSKVILLSDCSSKLRLDVQSFANFGGITPPKPTDKDGKLQNSFAYTPGNGGDVVLITTYYEWPLLTLLTSSLLSNLSDGNRLLQASAVFRNEPFGPN